MLKKITAIVSIVLIALIILLLVTLKVAPAIGIHFAGKWYAEQGEDYRLEVGDWQFSLFNTKLALHNVVLHHPNKGAGETALNKVFIQLNVWDFLDKKVSIQTIELEGLRINLLLEQLPDHEDIKIAGLSIPLAGDEEESQPEDEIEEENSEQEPWQVSLDKLAFKDLQLGWLLRLQDLNIQGKATLERLSVQEFSTLPGSQPQVHLALAVNELELNEPELKLQQPLKIQTRGRLSQILENPTWQGDLTISNALVQQGDLIVGFQSLELQEILANANQQILKSLQLNETMLQLGEHTQLNLQQLMAGPLQVDLSEELTLDLAAIELEQIGLAAPELAGAIENIVLNNITVRDQEQNIQSLVLQNLSLQGQDQELLTLDEYQLKNLTLQEFADELAFNLGEHSFAGLAVNVERNKKGNLVGFSSATVEEEAESITTSEDEQAPQEQEQTHAQTQEGSEAAAKILAVALASFLQQEDAENKGKVHIVDANITPKLKTQLTLNQLKIGQANGRIVAGDFTLGQTIPIHAELGLGGFSTTIIDAQLGIYQDDKIYPEGQIKLTTRKLDIVDFNGYIIQALGYQLDRGSLDIDADVSIHETKLKGEIKLLLRNAKFTPADEDKIDKISKQISMPLDTAIGLLRDKHGNVHLTIPVEGRLDDPDFGLKDITRQLTNKAFKATAMYLIKQSMQPYGTMLSVASFAGEYLLAIRLDALQYVAGSDELSDDHQANLKKVAELMQSKGKIEVRACPFVGEEELAELGDDWADLAKERGQAIKRWFEEHYTSESERLTLCRPQKGKAAEVVLGVS